MQILHIFTMQPAWDFTLFRYNSSRGYAACFIPALRQTPESVRRSNGMSADYMIEQVIKIALKEACE